MNKLQTFENEEFGQIRTVLMNGEPWLVGKDVAMALGYGEGKSLANAVANHVDNEDKGVTELMTPGGKQKMVIINESGLYSLVLSSKLPGAKKFRRWVTSEVLPSIRKNGGYIAGQEELSDAELMAKALLVANRMIEERNQTIQRLESEAEVNRPKIAFAECVSGTKGNITVGAFSNILFDHNGINMGRNRLFRWMRDEGFLQADNRPYQKYIDAGYFSAIEKICNGKPRTVTLIIGKGQIKLYEKLTGLV